MSENSVTQKAVYQLRSTDDDCAWVDCTEAEFNWWQGRTRESRKLCFAAPVAAAPGIDLEQLRKLHAEMAEFRSQWGQYGTMGVRELDYFIGKMKDLIDASPKGGSTDAKDAARWRVAREQDGVTISVEEADDEGDMQFVSGHTPEELDAAMDAMQATSAEVGA